jgi:hypothetical protein
MPAILTRFLAITTITGLTPISPTAARSASARAKNSPTPNPHALPAICLSLFLSVSSPLYANVDDVAVVAIAALTDPAKLATLKEARAANPRLLKCVYWLADAHGRGLLPTSVVADAQRVTGNSGAHVRPESGTTRPFGKRKRSGGAGLFAVGSMAITDPPEKSV